MASRPASDLRLPTRSPTGYQQMPTFVIAPTLDTGARLKGVSNTSKSYQQHIRTFIYLDKGKHIATSEKL